MFFVLPMYFESVLLLVSVALIVPYACFSVVNSLAATADEDLRKYSSKTRTGVSPTLATKKATPAPDGKVTAIVKASKPGAMVKQKG